MNERERERDMDMPVRENEDDRDTAGDSSMGRPAGDPGQDGDMGGQSWRRSSSDELDEEKTEMDRSTHEPRQS